jgi:hypothetical protein
VTLEAADAGIAAPTVADSIEASQMPVNARLKIRRWQCRQAMLTGCSSPDTRMP